MSNVGSMIGGKDIDEGKTAWLQAPQSQSIPFQFLLPFVVRVMRKLSVTTDIQAQTPRRHNPQKQIGSDSHPWPLRLTETRTQPFAQRTAITTDWTSLPPPTSIVPQTLRDQDEASSERVAAPRVTPYRSALVTRRV